MSKKKSKNGQILELPKFELHKVVRWNKLEIFNLFLGILAILVGLLNLQHSGVNSFVGMFGAFLLIVGGATLTRARLPKSKTKYVSQVGGDEDCGCCC